MRTRSRSHSLAFPVAVPRAIALVAVLGAPPAPASAAQKIAFVTSVTGNGNLSTWANAGGHTGLAAGDAICQARAQAASLGTPANFVAWLSDSNTDAYCRVHGFTGKKANKCGLAQLPTGAGPWVRPDGYPFGATIEQMIDQGVVYAPMRVTETAVTPTDGYFTGTSPEGTVWGPFSPPCNNWTSSSVPEVTIGDPLTTTDAWSYSGSGGCFQTRPLLCMEKGAGPALAPFAVSAREAFVTNSSGTGNLGSWPNAQGATGIAAGDAICRTEAGMAGRKHAATFKAWLSDATTNASARILADSVWVRVDGVLVALAKANLTNGSGLFSPINQNASGTYFGNSADAWTGTLTTGLKSTNTCNGWSSALAGVLGGEGIVNDASSEWTQFFSGTACSDASHHLYCLGDGARLAQPAQAAVIGTPITITGSAITAQSVLKVFVATSSGPVDVAPNGIDPTNVTSTSWTGTLPWPWPVGGANAKLMGNGFVSLALVQKDLGFDMTDAVGAVLYGNAAKSVPTILSLATFGLSATSSDPSVGTANVETVIPRNQSLAIGGGGFSNALVNVFTASGNIGPLTPTSQTANTINVTIPANAPIGPGSVQVVNGGTFQTSNAVSVPIGEAISVTGASINGNTVTVTGTGFNALTVVNLFARVGGVLTNVGGLNPNGSAKIALNIVSSHQLTFTRPAGLQAGGAYVQAINPPFIPYTSSGSGAGGALTLP
ncbi:MAG: hypothetical protein IPK07_13800 [Deltaproteobacteria bacterium]|nr:hypothetical protein [Deltaproteobacteria bacterium]